ncbi:LysR family transcriptional regulator (plasmid) [Cupriavidus necator]|uniref:LysR family transcriptional regulator n=1 Tax=Cupriavidus necator TaxID=106590 RepID=A0A367PAL5_CUPNE|nr:LysR family transcriptional regulator [Cupriavidus necator]QQX89563.1 LysR family transcriptional regulator [Cupriavidus necator]RCJ04076.1 LysR family transcriptional regulator [Cupriavidus necator]
MDIRQIRAFLAVAETGSVTRAAELLHVVQPSVSRQLKLLEEDLGVLLFERDRQGMLLTESGQIFIERARRALRELDSARAEVRPTRGALTGHVHIGLLPSSCEMLATPLVIATRSAHPGINLSLSVGFTDHLTRWLESGEVDAALLYDPMESASLNVHPLLTEPLWVCGPPSFGFGPENPIRIEVLGAHPLILPTRHHALRILVEHACAVANVRIKVATETNALAVHKDLVVHGVGLGIMPRAAIRAELEQGLLCAAPIDHSGFLRTIYYALPTTRRTTPSAAFVTTALAHCVRGAITSGTWLDATWLGEK